MSKSVRNAVLVLFTLISLSGCSALFVEGPPQIQPGGAPPAQVFCTGSMWLPNTDLVFGALNLVGGGLLIADSENASNPEDALAQGLTSLVMGGAQLISGHRGKRKVHECRDLRVRLAQPALPLTPPPVRLPHELTFPTIQERR